jgi:hypothetical protein
MVWGGNLLTHYRYSKCDVEGQHTSKTLDLRITTPTAQADLSVHAFLDEGTSKPPANSPFPDLKTARHFAGPLPFTFDYEAESKQMVIIEGVRQDWKPKPVRVEVARCTFFEAPPFNSVPLRLANAFFVENIAYRWKRGVIAPLAVDA